MYRPASLLIVMLLALASVKPSFAQAPEDDGSLRANCAGDYFRFCSSYSPGTLEIRQCFGRNMQQLTPACRGAIQKFDRRKPKDRKA